MSVISEKLIEVGYRRFVRTDDFDLDTFGELNVKIGCQAPADYIQFLIDFPNTGIFDADIVCKGIESAPCASEGLYPITILYASCSRTSYDLLNIRNIQSETPLHFLIIGSDDGGNYFCLDLRPESLGRIYFLFNEEEIETGSYLLANDFTSFIGSLQRG